MKIEEKRVKSILHSYIIYNLDETVRIDPDLVKAQILQLFEDERREIFREIEAVGLITRPDGTITEDEETVIEITDMAWWQALKSRYLKGK